MKYLLDEPQSYEMFHGDALHPVLKGTEQSFMGDHLSSIQYPAVKSER